MIKSELIGLFACPDCGGPYQIDPSGAYWLCGTCQAKVTCQDGIPVFTPIPDLMRPSEKIARGPEQGTPWRRANWQFLEQQVAGLKPDAVVLDVGAGRGDFASLFAGLNYLALDVYPYAEVDIVCDLTHTVPFKPGSLDAVVLMNVVEHVYDTQRFFEAIARMLKPGGVAVVAIPFMVKLHQVPFDFVRYTHFALAKFGNTHDLVIEHLEGFYDPGSFLDEALGNIQYWLIPAMRGVRHYAGRALMNIMRGTAALLQGVLGPATLAPPDQANSQAPTGYHAVYRKTVPGQVHE
jgi:SAM-dependent methyltransferase